MKPSFGDRKRAGREAVAVELEPTSRPSVKATVAGPSKAPSAPHGYSKKLFDRDQR